MHLMVRCEQLKTSRQIQRFDTIAESVIEVMQRDTEMSLLTL
jgi:hypothetical protein